MRLRVDFGRAVLAIGLAAALWIVVQNETNPDRVDVPNFTVMVEVRDIPTGLVVLSEAPQVQVRVRAPSDSWSRLRPGSFRATADASLVRPGVNEVPVDVEPLDSQVRSVEAIPPRVNVAIEEIGERSVPVRLNITGNVPFGYAYSTPRVTPENVAVSGPASVIQRVDAAIVELRLDGVTVGLNATYAPQPVDGRGGDVRGVGVSPPTVNVEVPVAQQVGYKEVGIRPVVRGRVAAGYYLQPVDLEPATVTVVGSPSTLAEVNFADTEPIDIGNSSTSVVRRVQVVPPPGLTLLQPQPVNVTLRVSPLIVSQAVRLVPSIENLSPGVELVSGLPQLEVTLMGPAPTLQALTPRDFRVVLDLAGLRAGTHDVEPRVTVPPGFSLERVEPARVTITLREAPTPAPLPTATPAPTDP